MNDAFDPYREWLGLKSETTPRDYYALLQLARFESEVSRIAHAADRAMAQVRRCRPGARAAQWAALLDELAAAKTCLTDSIQKAAYDEQLRQRGSAHSDARPAPSSASPQLAPVNLDPNLFPPGMGPPTPVSKSTPADTDRTPAPRSTRAATARQRRSATTGSGSRDPMAPVATPQAKSPDPDNAEFEFDAASLWDPMAPVPSPASLGTAVSHTPAAPRLTRASAPKAPIAQPGLGSPAPAVAATTPSQHAPTAVPAAEPNQRVHTRRRRPVPWSLMVTVGGSMVLLTAAVLILATYPSWNRGAKPPAADPTNASGPAGPAVRGPSRGEPGSAATPNPAGPLRPPASSTPPPKTTPTPGPMVRPENTAAPPVPQGGAPVRDPSPPHATPPGPRPDQPSASPSSAANPPMTPAKPPVDPPPMPTRLTPQERESLFAALRDARDALGDKDYVGAQKAIQRAESLARESELKPLVARVKRLADCAQRFWKATQQAVASIQAGTEIKTGDTVSIVVDKGPGWITVRTLGQNARFRIEELPPGLAAALAERQLGTSPETLVLKGAFIATLPDLDPQREAKVRAWWQEADQNGYPLKDLPQVLDDPRS